MKTPAGVRLEGVTGPWDDMVGKNGGKNDGKNDGLEQYHLTAGRCGATAG
jgi:hypothetical protein